MNRIRNHTFEEIFIGQTASFSRQIGEKEVLLFAAASGDVNPVHLDAEYAAGTLFKTRIAHGMLSASVISAALALELPGPGTIYLGQSLRFLRPVKLGDILTAQLEVESKQEDNKTISLACMVLNQHGKTVITGSAEVMAPVEKIEIDRPDVPSFDSMPTPPTG